MQPMNAVRRKNQQSQGGNDVLSSHTGAHGHSRRTRRPGGRHNRSSRHSFRLDWRLRRPANEPLHRDGDRGVLTLTNAYVPGANITAADFVSFSYTSNALSFTISPADADGPLYFAGGLTADGDITGGAGERDPGVKL